MHDRALALWGSGVRIAADAGDADAARPGARFCCTTPLLTSDDRADPLLERSKVFAARTPPPPKPRLPRNNTVELLPPPPCLYLFGAVACCFVQRARAKMATPWLCVLVEEVRRRRPLWPRDDSVVCVFITAGPSTKLFAWGSNNFWQSSNLAVQNGFISRCSSGELFRVAGLRNSALRGPSTNFAADRSRWELQLQLRRRLRR